MVKIHPFWEQPEIVKNWATLPPNERLEELLRSYQHPNQTRVLDLGCGAGRHTAMLAEKGFDVYALDASPAMIEKTQERVTAVLGQQEAITRVRLGQMEDLRDFASESFHLVVAMAVYHHATSQQQWENALKETDRVLMAGGQVLVTNFSPRSEISRWDLFGRMSVLEAEELDAAMSCYGLLPVVPTKTVKVEWRVIVNGLYRKHTHEA